MAGSSELVLIGESASCWSFGLIPWKNHIESQVNATCRASWKWGKNPKFQGRSHHWCQICGYALSKVLLLVPWFIENLLELCKSYLWNYLWNYSITELITILRTTELWNLWNYELVKRKNFGTLWNYVLFWKVKTIWNYQILWQGPTRVRVHLSRSSFTRTTRPTIIHPSILRVSHLKY